MVGRGGEKVRLIVEHATHDMCLLCLNFNGLNSLDHIPSYIEALLVLTPRLILTCKFNPPLILVTTCRLRHYHHQQASIQLLGLTLAPRIILHTRELVSTCYSTLFNTKLI